MSSQVSRGKAHKVMGFIAHTYSAYTARILNVPHPHPNYLHILSDNEEGCKNGPDIISVLKETTLQKENIHTAPSTGFAFRCGLVCSKFIQLLPSQAL